MITRSRVDCIVVWGHGIKYLEHILSEIESHRSFDILKVVRKKPRSISKFIKEVYNYDYAPFEHLKEKTSYLKSVRREVCLVVIENKYPCLDYFGVGDFRHLECRELKIFKEKIRSAYNPTFNGVRTHDHVIHATDNETQAFFLLKYFDLTALLKRNQRGFPRLRHHIKETTRKRIMEVEIGRLSCAIPVGKGWGNYHIEYMAVDDTPHYRALTNPEVYGDYIKKFIGGPIRDWNSTKRYEEMKLNFEYLGDGHETNYVVVKSMQSGFLVLDGIHRCALHRYAGNSSITVLRLE